MSGDHNHTHENAHGVPHPPSTEELQKHQEEGVRGSEMTPLHFFKAGPMDVRPLSRRRRVRLRDGTYQRCDWEFRWFMETVSGTTTRTALKKIYDVILSPRGWTRAGVHWKRVYTRGEADILVRVLPQDETVCGVGAAGCYSWGYEHDKKPVAEMGVEYIDRPGPFAALVNMELLGHGTFRADDMYFSAHLPYAGVMGTWEAMARAGFMPTDQEVLDSRTWLEGNTPPDLIHRH